MRSGSLDALWLDTLQQVIGKAAHEVKDALNGVALNLEVVTSRSKAGVTDQGSLTAFAVAAYDQFDVLAERTEAMLFLVRAHRTPGEPADVAVTLKHLATLLVPATKADGGSLVVEGLGPGSSAPTAVSAPAVRLALGAGLLAITKEGGSGSCRLQTGPETVVRFSHESAVASTLDPAITSAVADHKIRIERSDSDLALIFPGP